MVANVGYGRRKKKSGEVREKKNDGCSRRRGGGVAITGWHEADKDVGGRNDGLSWLWREEEEACKGEKERSSRWCYCSLRWDGLEKKVGSLLFTAVLRWCG
jgi:hypothetical protein